MRSTVRLAGYRVLHQPVEPAPFSGGIRSDQMHPLKSIGTEAKLLTVGADPVRFEAFLIN